MQIRDINKNFDIKEIFSSGGPQDDGTKSVHES